MSKLTTLLLWISGEQDEIMTHGSLKTAINNGLTILLVSIFASFSFGYVIYSTSGGYIVLPIFLSLTWGIIIFYINRYLASSQINIKNIKSIIWILPRILISFVITITICYPLLLIIFEKSIIQKAKELQYNEISNKYAREINVINKTANYYDSLLMVQSNLLASFQNKYSNEISGRVSKGTTGIIGFGPLSRFYENIINDKKLEIININNNRSLLAKQIDSIYKNESFQRSMIFSKYDVQFDFLSRSMAFNALKENNNTISVFSILLYFLFFLIELMPFILKLTVNKIVDYETFADIDKKFRNGVQTDIELFVNEATNFSNDQKISEFDTLLEKLKKQNESVISEGLDQKNSFELYFISLKTKLEKQSEIADIKASKLLDKGLNYTRFGIGLYLILIIVWSFLYKDSLLSMKHLASLISCSILFVFIEFLSAWFLKQYRHYVDTSTYLIKVKSIFERFFLSYLLIQENSDNNEFKMKMLENLMLLLKEEIKWPNTYSYENENIGFAKETIESISHLTSTIRDMASKKA